MSMRIGTVDGKPVKRVRLNSDGRTMVQPVKKVLGVNSTGTNIYHLENDGEQFIVEHNKFIKGHI